MSSYWTGGLAILLTSLIGWQIGIQVQVSRVDNAAPSFALATTNTSGYFAYIDATANPLYVTSSGINLNTFLVVSLCSVEATLSGRSSITFSIYFQGDSAFVGDGIQEASLTVDALGLPSDASFIGGSKLNLPAVLVYDNRQNLVKGRVFSHALNSTRITVSFVPTNGTLVGTTFATTLFTVTLFSN